MSGRGGRHPVVGREAELAVLTRAVERAAEASPTVVLVSGDAGIGKSTLLAEVAATSGAPVFLGRCVHVGGDAIPLAPLVDLVRQIQRRPPEEIGDVAADGALGELAAALGAGAAGSRRTDVFDLALRLVGELGRAQPVLIGFE